MIHAEPNRRRDSVRHPATRRQIIDLLQKHRADLKKLGVKRIDLFGSAARGELGPHSDVDMVVEFSQTTYRRFIEVKSFLESILGRKVDLLTPPAVQGRLKDEIEKDLIHVPT
ncbi:MAG: nucleotidyltransferase family protein [Phycisphaerales bacterium]